MEMDFTDDISSSLWGQNVFQHAIHPSMDVTDQNLLLSGEEYSFCPSYDYSSTQSLEERALEAYYHEFGRPFVPWVVPVDSPEWSGYAVEEPTFGSTRDIHNDLGPDVDLDFLLEVSPESNGTINSHGSPHPSHLHHPTCDIHNTPSFPESRHKALTSSATDENEAPFEVQWAMPETAPTKSEGRPVNQDRFYTTTSNSMEQGVTACPRRNDFSLNKTPDERLAWELRDNLTPRELIVFFPKAIITYWGILKLMKETEWSISDMACQILLARGQHNDRCKNRIRAYINKKVCAILRDVTGDKNIRALSFIEDWVRGGKARDVIAPNMKGLKDVLLRDVVKDITVWPEEDKVGVFTKVARHAIDHGENWKVSETFEVAKAKEWM